MTNSKEDQFPVLIERHLKFQPASGGSLVDVVVQIGYPKWVNLNLEASCPVAFRGGIGRVKDIAGIDPLNAMKNAITFVESYLSPDGRKGKFFWNDGEEYDG